MKVDEKKLRESLSCIEEAFPSDSSSDHECLRLSGETLLHYCSNRESLEWDDSFFQEWGFENERHLWGRVADVLFDCIDRCRMCESIAPLIEALAYLQERGFTAHFRKMRQELQLSNGPENVIKALDLAIENVNGECHFDVQFDVAYTDGGHPRHCLDIYRPAGAKADEKLPVILYYHGGSWEFGARFNAIKRLRHYASLPCVFVSVGYRLSGEVSWPEPMKDCLAAVDYIKANGEKLGMDTQKMGLWGSSAGAHLAALLAGGIFDSGSSQYSFFVNYCAPVALDRYVQAVSGPERELSPVMKLLGGEGPHLLEYAKQASVTSHLNPDFPPSIMVHGQADETVPVEESIYLSQQLNELGVENELFVVEGSTHRLDEFQIKGRVHSYLSTILSR